jgi:hypothetical protein
MIGSGSKANCLRGFWAHESNYLVGKLIGALIDYGHEIDAFKNDGGSPEDCRRIVERLAEQGAVSEIDQYGHRNTLVLLDRHYRVAGR